MASLRGYSALVKCSGFHTPYYCLPWLSHQIQKYSDVSQNSHASKTSRKTGHTPTGKLDETADLEREQNFHPHREKEPLEKFPHGKNPVTGEIGGPSGPEPTRYGDWERKGRVTDF
ncbi:hypothetical protein ScPMuIL_017992 [Solemya velum]